MTIQITTCPHCGHQTGMYEAGRTESIAANQCASQKYDDTVEREYHAAEQAFFAEVTANGCATRAINDRRRLAKEALMQKLSKALTGSTLNR